MIRSIFWTSRNQKINLMYETFCNTSLILDNKCRIVDQDSCFSITSSIFSSLKFWIPSYRFAGIEYREIPIWLSERRFKIWKKGCTYTIPNLGSRTMNFCVFDSNSTSPLCLYDRMRSYTLVANQKQFCAVMVIMIYYHSQITMYK